MTMPPTDPLPPYDTFIAVRDELRRIAAQLEALRRELEQPPESTPKAPLP